MPKGTSTWEQIAPHRIPDNEPHVRQASIWAPHCQTGYVIEAGRVERVRIPQDGLLLDLLGHRAGSHDGMMLSGTEDEHWHDWTLPRIAEIAERLTPWATWLAAPAFFGSGAEGRGFVGYAWWHHGVCLMRSDRGPREAIRTAMHEAWHLAEGHLSPAEIATVQAACDQGNTYPAGSYNARPAEMRAQLFEDWATAIWAGGGIHIGKAHPEVAVMWRVFSGELGRDVARRRRAPAARLPPALLSSVAADREAARQPVLARFARGLLALAG